MHAALVHHKHLNRAFLVDLGSTHGTYIGSVRLEGHKPTPLPMDRCAYKLQTPTYSHNHLLMLFTATSSTITLLKLYIRKRFHDFSVFHFGASTRNYVIRERPQTGARPVMEEIEKTSMTAEGDKGAALLGKCLIKMMRNFFVGNTQCLSCGEVLWWDIIGRILRISRTLSSEPKSHFSEYMFSCRFTRV